MKAYNYNMITKEYTGSETIYLDKVASMREGKEIYLLPAFSTLVEPPKNINHHEVFVWNGKEWEVKEDYRGETLYNISTREPLLCKEIGPIPKGFALELKPSLTELKANYLMALKVNFNKYLNDTKITIPNLGLSFLYKSLDNLQKERDLGLVASRDDNNQVYVNLTREEYDVIIGYLLTFGQLVYLYKWNMEQSINNCKNLELLEGLKDKLIVKIDMSQVTNLMRMSEERRKEYFARVAKTIK